MSHNLTARLQTKEAIMTEIKKNEEQPSINVKMEQELKTEVGILANDVDRNMSEIVRAAIKFSMPFFKMNSHLFKFIDIIELKTNFDHEI